MEVTYSAQGEYLIPNLTLPQQEAPAIGKYGMLRRTYLQNHKPALYQSLLVKNQLHQHLAQIQQETAQAVEALLAQMLKTEPAPDKATHQMEWVQHMNNLKQRAEEQVMREKIYH